MRQLAYLIILPLLFFSCRGGKGRIRIEGSFQNLNQVDFLIYSPNGGFEDIDTLHLLKGKFRKNIPLKGGPYTFTIIYPNFATLSFVASEGDNVRIDGDALALADVLVQGADSVITLQSEVEEERLKIGQRLPKVDIIEKSRRSGRYMLIGFWANWRGGASVVNTQIKRSIEDYGDQICALSYSLDIDQRIRQAAVGNDSTAWDSYCDYLAWDSPAVRTLGINNIPYMILLDPNGKIVAKGSNFRNDIEPSLQKKLKKKKKKEEQK